MNDEDKALVYSIKEQQEYYYREIRKGIQFIVFLLIIGLITIHFS